MSGMITPAEIERIENGYLLSVRWPFAGSPIGGGKVFVKTLDEALPILRKHFNDSQGGRQNE